jgi:uncharacterized phiE125 gp8 family phage protein
MRNNERLIGVVTEPVTLAEARRHCRIDADTSDGHPDDSMLEIYISAARAYAENFTGLAFGKQTLELGLDEFPEEEIELLAPTTSITSVKYYDADGILTTIDADNYVLDDFSKPSYLFPVNGYTWPTAESRPKAVRIVYLTGYGDDSDSEPIPFEAKAAILLIIGHLYENREEVVEHSNQTLLNIPTGAEALLRPLRVRLGMA